LVIELSWCHNRWKVHFLIVCCKIPSLSKVDLLSGCISLKCVHCMNVYMLFWDSGEIMMDHLLKSYSFSAQCKKPCQLISAGFYTSGHCRVQPRAAELHGFQCRLDSYSEHLGLNSDLLRNTIGIQIGKYFWWDLFLVKHITLLNVVIVKNESKYFFSEVC